LQIHYIQNEKTPLFQSEAVLEIQNIRFIRKILATNRVIKIIFRIEFVKTIYFLQKGKKRGLNTKRSITAQNQIRSRSNYVWKFQDSETELVYWKCLKLSWTQFGWIKLVKLSIKQLVKKKFELFAKLQLDKTELKQ